ncbi:MAG: SEC-C domain-containing protein [Chromatiales bacterium]|nr:SEC-C domain-containing protein [Chromatiales bacterium]
MSETCPCGSGKTFDACCGPILAGGQAATPEALMRARYTAYVRMQLAFLGDSLHPEHRDDYDPDATRRWAEQAEWLGLEVIGSQLRGDDDGMVEFIARYREKGVPRKYHERAVFKRSDGRWYFVDGRMVSPPTVTRETPKVGRNDPCPCGSGKKYKKCCGQAQAQR